MRIELLSFSCIPLDEGEDAFLRHSHFCFLVDGISRACSHQLVRHRVASYSQQSQRYVSMKDFPYVKPKTVEGKVVEIDGLKMDFDGLMRFIGKFYEALVEEGVPKEDARFVLPNACSTRIVFTMNGEELVHFLRLRTCNRAQWEIRDMAIGILKILIKRFPKVFSKVGPNCYYLGYCTEGKKSCGKQDEVRAFFSNLSSS
ncbi:thymidylate synthase (FAD) [Desulfurobacterium pacificum]|jgi:thymidylate synthase (FAD)|uniref:FAD-dependent thymidylate synthase n=1 Tax=Desulfurobacterium pacificum TaxID=240166 RepID=A0ABY1N6K4_9BACT|nr:FAD-dependent thymidylate synthase [Desulfurobacterium pacificum]SMP01813.1 thymidylate synthase (FAD) [Desulfurobacterium pacificum]